MFSCNSHFGHVYEPRKQSSVKDHLQSIFFNDIEDKSGDKKHIFNYARKQFDEAETFRGAEKS